MIAGLDATLDRTASGAKAATLGQLREAGFTVPDGFVIEGSLTTDDLGSALAVLGGDSFAVRSSAPDEDGAGSSMAGQYRSHLSVPPDGVAAAVASCRAEDGYTGISVIVQTMVDSEVSGVAFTADPVTGDRSLVVIDADHGLGDRLMGGAIDGEEWEVSGRRARKRRGVRSALTNRLAKKVARLAKRVEDHLDMGPLDIEWSWDGKDLWIVQARPITGLPPDVSWGIDHRGVFHRGFRLGEWISEPLTPLFESWLLTVLEERMHQVHREQIGQFAPKPHHLVVNGWYFYSLNFLPVPGASFWRSLPRVLRLSVTTPRRVAVMFPQTVLSGYRLYEEEWRTELEPPYRLAIEVAEQTVETGSLKDMLTIVDGLARLTGDYFASIAVVAGSAYKVETLLAQFWNRHLRPRLERSHLDLLGGLDEIEIDARRPLLASLDWYVPIVYAQPSNEFDRSGARERRIATEAAARSALAGSRRRLARFEELLAHAQHLQHVREAQMTGLSSAWPVMRRAVERIGEAIAEAGNIPSADDVFFLEYGQMLDAIEGRRIDASTVNQRRTERDAAKRLVPPDWVGRMPLMTRVAFEITNRAFGARRNLDAIVTGVPASAGHATGPVRVVLGPSDFDSVKPGDVIVAPLTAPAWTPLFAEAAAVVTDVGSGLAHASIIAREFGIPAVVGCGDATKRLANDQIVTVDGRDGSVRRVGSATR